jgi:hypothetical protein
MVDLLVHCLTQCFLQSLIPSFLSSFLCSFTHPFTPHSFICSFIHSFFLSIERRVGNQSWHERKAGTGGATAKVAHLRWSRAPARLGQG